jgi:[ribosomal protein S18]-alanine N-acetyltransferase
MSEHAGSSSRVGPMQTSLSQLVIEPMTEVDVPRVSRLERRCFTNPWPQAAYRRELRNPAQNYYIVLRQYLATDVRERDSESARIETNGSADKVTRIGLLASWMRRGTEERNGSRTPRIVGFGGFWMLFDEAHITTIGVDPDLRGRSLGELLLLDLIEEAIARGAGFVTLEVRVSNTVAINLYEKYGFTTHGVRPRYYADNGEDAYVMWSEDVRTPAYRERLVTLRSRLSESLGSAAELPVAGNAGRPGRAATRDGIS